MPISLAARVYDQDHHTEADLAFLDAVWAADREMSDQLHAANLQWGGGSEAWHAVLRLATRSRNVAYQAAVDELLQAREDA